MTQRMVKPATVPTPYLSVVAASRNDDHGGDPLVRTQIFVNCFARQCEKYRLPAELILVDWNPVPGRPGLAGVLQLPAEASFCTARIITVPAVLHDQFKYAERLPFLQMIAKNAGIRRARGKFILATNIDIIFSDELMRHLGRQQLDPKKMLRVDRYDIQAGLSAKLTLDETLDYAWSHPVRANRRYEPKLLVDHLYADELFKRECRPDPEVCRRISGVTVAAEGEFWSVRPQQVRTVHDLHTNACGDFTLLAREGWDAITGYPEFEAYSFHIDSIGIVAAHFAGFEEAALLPPCVCFHIEHSLGSGWTPEGERELFARLKKNEVLNPEWHVLTPLVEGMRKKEKPTALNGPSWGLSEFQLPEQPLLVGKVAPTPLQPTPYSTPAGLAVCALLPGFDLDRLTLWQDRKRSPTERLTEALEEARSNLKKAEEYLRLVDKDRNDRMAALEDYEQRMEKTVGFLHEVEKDSAERLERILFYQDKLNQAYADHAHNVAYIEKIHAELAAHAQVGAEKDAIIARLNEQLRAATERSTAGT